MGHTESYIVERTKEGTNIAERPPGACGGQFSENTIGVQPGVRRRNSFSECRTELSRRHVRHGPVLPCIGPADQRRLQRTRTHGRRSNASGLSSPAPPEM